jgi:hypothetical protein
VRSARAVRLRTILSAVCFALALVVMPVAVVGVWNPWNYVVLDEYFRDPFADATLVLVLAFAGGWLLPVRDEARQHHRVMARWVLTGLLVLSLVSFGIATRAYDRTVVTVASHGDRRLVAITTPSTDIGELRMYAGRGLTERDIGHVGLACNGTGATFVSRDEVKISNSYADFDIHLDPVSGAPRNDMGPRCV